MLTIFTKNPGEEAWLKRHEFCQDEAESEGPEGHLSGGVQWAFRHMRPELRREARTGARVLRVFNKPLVIAAVIADKFTQGKHTAWEEQSTE